MNRIICFCLLASWACGKNQSAPQNDPLIYSKKPVVRNLCGDWKEERIDFPLSFASELPYEGYEILRFAPGMYDEKSEEFFTYAFVMNLKGAGKLEALDLQQLLLTYFKGLMKVVSQAKSKANQEPSQPIDLDSFRVRVENRNSRFFVYVDMIDAFVTNEGIELFMDIDQSVKGQDSCLRIVASPQKTNHPIWQDLENVRQNCFRCFAE